MGLTVADLTDNGIPDLIVANAGSNDLSIFIGEGQGANWSLQVGPRLRVGDQPVSTTVAESGEDDIPDIICVDQGSDNVVVLRGLGGGFFADNDPLTLPTGQGPIEAFVGKFDAAPGEDLAVLDSGSNNLAYYSNFLGGRTSLAFVLTGGIGPIAAVMGDYKGDGYDDLIIANNADNRITLLDGGPEGLVLTGSELLDQPIRPTDLVISATDPGQLHLDISAAGQNQVIPVTFTLGLAISGSIPGPGNSPTPEVSAQSGASRGSLISGNGLSSFDLSSAETGSQEQALVQAVTISSAPTATSSQSGLTTASIASSLQPVINPSLSSLSGVINSLMQLSQVQISDIMPLNNSAVDAVAVLLVVSSTPNEGSTGNDQESPGESQRRDTSESELALLREPQSTAVGSSLERFLADLESALISVPIDDFGSTAQPNGDWSEVTWQPTNTGTLAATVGGLGGTTAFKQPGSTDTGESPLTAQTDVDRWGIAGLDWTDGEPSSTSEITSIQLGWVKPFGGMVAVAAVLLGWQAGRKRFVSRRRQPIVRRMPAIAGPHTTRLKASRSIGSKAARVQDLPPWLAGPT